MSKRILAIILAAVTSITVLTACADNGGNNRVAVVDYNNTYQGNPFLPLWEYIPDGEPYVFEDPDNPGKYRVYIYGSHDILKTEYCGKDLVVWSAPVEDLSAWRNDGVIFECFVDGKADTLYAPDIALVEDKDTGEKTYYLYPNNQGWGRNTMVCKSSRPDGPFEVINWIGESKTQTAGVLGFDPAVYVDDNGEVYGYWGFQSSWWGKLSSFNMSELDFGETSHKNIPSYDQMMAEDYNPEEYNIYQDKNTKKWGFFEASSIRKVGNKYVFIYSRNGLHEEPTGKNYSQLAYGYSDSPEGPWKWGGIIVDAAGEVIPNGDGGYYRTFNGGNTHGSICEINGQWYVFYHRNLHTYARQSMVEPIEIEWDEKPVSEGGKVKISTAEVTSNGFYINGLNPYVKHSAGNVCYLTGGSSIVPAYTEDTTTLPITDLRRDSIAGFKYFNFDIESSGGSTSLEVEVVPKGVNGRIDVYLRPMSAVNTPSEKTDGVVTSVGKGSYIIGSFELTEDMPQELTTLRIETPEIDKVNGQWGIFFVFESKRSYPICDFYTMQFVDSNEAS
ncbi:MAG: family 43 glycosylhydrolase [Oscillospiraceae bacterium]|nr:family 43 glycosylhydrolase [Oscillospiraceae bacterium]